MLSAYQGMWLTCVCLITVYLKMGSLAAAAPKGFTSTCERTWGDEEEPIIQMAVR
jgi:hypothetical protein